MNIEMQKIIKEIKKQKQNRDREKETQKIKEEKLKLETISLKNQVTELKAVNWKKIEINQMTMTELRRQTEEQKRSNLEDHISTRNESTEVVKKKRA